MQKSAAGRNVTTVSLAASAVDIVVGEVGAVVRGRGALLDREPGARAGAELVRVDPQAEPRRLPGPQHRPRLVLVERAHLAEHVDPPRVRRARRQHLAADEVDVVVGPTLELGRHRVGPEEGHVVGERRRELDETALVRSA